MNSFILKMTIALTFCADLCSAQPKIADKPFIEDFRGLSKASWYLSNGWRNGSHQNCTWSKRALALSEAGIMRILFVPSGIWGVDAYCGEIQTRRWFQYGTFEARMRADLGSGRNAAFFAFGGSVHDLPHGEIDFELITKNSQSVWTNRFVGGDDLGEGEFVPDNPDLSEFHDYAFIWEPTRIRWFIDGVLVREVSEHVPNHRLKVYFSHWGSDTFKNWMGPFVEPASPVALEIDRFAYTPLGEDCAFAESVLCALK